MAWARDEADQRLLDRVREFGWDSVGVETGTLSPFAYSVGLYQAFRHPEVLVIGPRPVIGHSLLANVALNLGMGHRFQEGDESSVVLEGYAVCFCAVGPEFYEDYLARGLWYYEGARFPVLQCVLPDRRGRFPWDPDCAPALRQRQPVLNEAWIHLSRTAGPEWPFAEEPNEGALTTRAVVEGDLPIVEAVRDAAHGTWGFFCDTPARYRRALMVPLADLVTVDPSITAVADLPPGWQARRAGPDSPWHRSPRHDQSGEGSTGSGGLG